MKVRLADFPQLRLIAWNRQAETEIEEQECPPRTASDSWSRSAGKRCVLG